MAGSGLLCRPIIVRCGEISLADDAWPELTVAVTGHEAGKLGQRLDRTDPGCDEQPDGKCTYYSER